MEAIGLGLASWLSGAPVSAGCLAISLAGYVMLLADNAGWVRWLPGCGNDCLAQWLAGLAGSVIWLLYNLAGWFAGWLACYG